MAERFDPSHLQDGARTFRATRELIVALALVDGPAPRAWLRCRSAALRYLEVGRDGRLQPEVALRLLEGAVHRWATPELTEPARRRLAAALPFWAGTAYGLRWRAGPAAGERTRMAARPPSAVTDRTRWAPLRATEARARRACESAATTVERSEGLCRTASALVGETRRLRAVARGLVVREPGVPTEVAGA